MFVRNDTKCPLCGKSSLFDITFQCWESSFYVTLRATCYGCLEYRDATFSAGVIRDFLLNATQLLSKSDSRRRCWKWRSWYGIGSHTSRSQLTLSFLLLEMFYPDQVSGHTFCSCTYRQLCQYILTAGKSRIEHRFFTASLGQPLAS